MMCLAYGLFFFKQKTAYEMRISDWSSDVCSSDLAVTEEQARLAGPRLAHAPDQRGHALHIEGEAGHIAHRAVRLAMAHMVDGIDGVARRRSEEHTSELQSLMRNSYAVFCLKKKKLNINTKAAYTDSTRQKTPT